MSRLKRKRLPRLLNDPRTHRMPGDVEVQNASSLMADDEKELQNTKRERGTVKKPIVELAEKVKRKGKEKRQIARFARFAN